MEAILILTAVVAVITACKLAYDIGCEDERAVFGVQVEDSRVAYAKGYNAALKSARAKRDAKGRFLKRTAQ